MIKNVELIDNYKIKFFCDDKDVILTALGDCCSESWFECFDGTSFDDCIGKTYIECCDTYETIDMVDSGIQDVDINHVYKIVFDNDTEFKFILRNSSNGYYDGYVDEEIKNVYYEPIEGTFNSLIILVGLPGCGKTTYGKMLNESMKNSIFYDDIDFMLQINISKIRKDIQNKKKVIVANANFCDTKYYCNFIEKVNLTNKNTSIITYCFLPDKEKSIRNIKNREQNETIINKLLSDIELLSMYYNGNFGINCKKLNTY